MKLKFDALVKNNIWTLGPKPKNKKHISSKWVFRVKLKSDKFFFDKYKSSKVAEGYKKKYRIDYSETFSLIVKPQTMRIVLILAISYD